MIHPFFQTNTRGLHIARRILSWKTASTAMELLYLLRNATIVISVTQLDS